MQCLRCKSLDPKTQKYLMAAIALIAVAGIVVLFVFVNINKKDVPTKPLTLALINNKSFVAAIKQKPQKEKEIILTDASKILREQIHSVTDNKHKDFVPDDFINVNPIIDFMLTLDSKNGHAIYFRGEVYRLLNNNDRFVEYFQQYLHAEDSIGLLLPRVTDARLCYDTPHGFCEKRTAWISQLLANYYYKKGMDEPDLNKKEESFNAAIKYIRNVRTHFPDGFKSSSVTMSTLELETNLSANIN